ncbi:MAG: hypothetical protein JXQ67_09610 [Campylobacterales bacterium]|nr:hypothetical protein [Campylobacterales bacterium]
MDKRLSIDNFVDNSERLEYYFTPTPFLSNFTPLMIILDEKETHLHFEHKMWNILTPIVESQQKLQLLCKSVEEIAFEHELEEHIYTYASGHKAYTALYCAFQCSVNALFLDTPIISLEEISHLEEVVSKVNQVPIVYICNNNSTELESFLNSFRVQVRFELCETLYTSKESRVKEIMDMLAKESSA